MIIRNQLKIVMRKIGGDFSNKKYRQLIYKPDHNQLKDPLNVMPNMNTKPRVMEILY